MNLAPLSGLRLRTPRLELHLPDDDAIEQLYRVAAAGIHPPEEMPFGVAWTDDLNRELFVGYHRSLRESWRPDAWKIDLGVWAEGTLVGVQGIGADDFASKRTIATGSWLGAPYQGRGIGTEMRAAVLELAFTHLRSQAVTSGAFEANLASRRVSEKLGYRVVGREMLSPRGAPQPHVVLRLERADWHGPPVSVEIEGVAPCLALFGAG